MNTIEIANPMPGGSWYTSQKKAREFVRWGMAVIEDGMLRFIKRGLKHDNHRQSVCADENPFFWNGTPKPKILAKVSIRTIMQEEIRRGSPLHKPGEVRS